MPQMTAAELADLEDRCDELASSPSEADADVLRRLRQRVYDSARSIVEEVSETRGSFLASERRLFDRHTDALDRVDDAIARQKPRLEQVRAAQEKYDHMATSPTRTAPGAEELRSFLRGETRTVEFNLPDADERRDLTVGTATAGGNTVPTSFVNQLYEHMIETSAVRRTNVTIFSTSSGEDLQVPKTTAHSSASLVAEGATISESDPTFGQVTLGAFKYGGLIQVSTELLEDSGVNLTGYLARQAGRAIGNASGAHFVTGTGSSQPRGVVTAASTGVTGGTGNSGVPQADELIDLYHSVIPEYRGQGYWMMSDATAAEVRKLTDSNGQFLWQTGLTAGNPDRLLGRPVVIDPNVADAALSAESVVFGDFAAYAIRDVRTVRFERSDDFAFDTDLVTFRFLHRTDGDLVDETGAIKTFVGGAS